MTAKDTRTYAELCKAAVELEREFRWSAAADLYALASKKAKHPPARQAALGKRDLALRTAADQEEKFGAGITRAAEPVSPAPIEASPLPGGSDSTLIGAGETDVLAGPPAGAVEAAMPQVPALTPTQIEAVGEALAHAKLEEDARAAVEAVLDAPKIPKTKTTNKEKIMATTETAKLSDREAMLAKKERVRMKQNKIEVGMELQHIRRGKTLARCTYAAERQFVYKGKVYSSLSDAGSAAAKDIGLKNPSVNGWIFWGIEKREA